MCKASLGSYLTIINGFGDQSCTELETVPPKRASAVINWNEISGLVDMSQNSPFDVTLTTVSLQGFDPKVSYLFHQLIRDVTRRFRGA